MPQSVIIDQKIYELLEEVAEAREDISYLVKRFKINPQKFGAFVKESGLEKSQKAQALLQAATALVETKGKSAARSRGTNLDVGLRGDVHRDDNRESYDENMSDLVVRAEEMAREVSASQADWAYRMWQVAGEQQGLAFDFYTAAQKYVESVAHTLMYTAKDVPSSEEQLAQLREVLSGSQYFDRTRDLAYRMWVESGRLPGTTLAQFWRDATKHVSAVVIGAAKSATSAAEVVDALSQTLASFSPTEHLREIQELAYQRWVERGAPNWHAIDDWVEAENEFLRRKVEGKAVARANDRSSKLTKRNK